MLLLCLIVAIVLCQCVVLGSAYHYPLVLLKLVNIAHTCLHKQQDLHAYVHTVVVTKQCL